MDSRIEPKCHFCETCDGHGCVSELPGMGGVYDNENFIRNCADWDRYAAATGAVLPEIRLAPITGAMQNVGYAEERPFYGDLVNASVLAGIRLSIGDGYPDEKLRFGIEALSAAGKKGAVFIKPYENDRILERMEWAAPVAECVGVDIDSYAILTMRNLVNLQQKTPTDLLELKAYAGRLGLPFMIKGIFRPEDLALVEAVRPDIIVISNHGGRVATVKGSTVDFLAEHARVLASHSGQVWVDGGIRKRRDLLVASTLGASEVMVARPFITALLHGGLEGPRNRLREMLS